MGSTEQTATAPGARLALSFRTRPALTAFAIAFAGTLLVALSQGEKPFYFDSYTYWILADSFSQHGGFSLLSFDNPLRGYLLPLINLPLRELADALGWRHSTLVKLFNSAIFAAIGTVLAPKLAEVTWPQRRWGLLPRLGLAALLVLLWRGYLNFPLSDFPAVAAVLLALVAVARTTSPGWMLVAGAAAAAAINMRPAYLLLLAAIALLVAWSLWTARGEERPDWGRRALCIGLLLLGFVVVSLPQSLSAHRYHDTWSFVPGARAGLTTLQFTEGTRMQRYDTYVGGDLPPRMIFDDRTGTRILMEEGGVIVDAGQYLGVIADHPVEMAGLFGRHVINGLDLRYNTPYVERPDTGQNRWMRILGFLFVFVALARIAVPATRRALGPARWRYPAALVLCGATSLASAVEARFLLPTYLLSYVLVLTPGWPDPRTLVRRGAGWRGYVVPVAALLAFAVYMAVVLNVIGNATEDLRFVDAP